jgi:hypothetical protein
MTDRGIDERMGWCSLLFQYVSLSFFHLHFVVQVLFQLLVFCLRFIFLSLVFFSLPLLLCKRRRARVFFLLLACDSLLSLDCKFLADGGHDK